MAEKLFLTNEQLDKMISEAVEKLTNEKIDEMKTDMYLHLGQFLEQSQRVEYFLKKFSPNKISKTATLGKIISRIYNVEALDWQMQYIKEIKSRRDYYVHQFFQEKIEEGKAHTVGSLERDLHGLKQTIAIMAICEEELKKTLSDNEEKK